MYILGLNAFHGDSSACIYKNDQLILAIEEERLRRVKHWAGFPALSIRACLDAAGIDISQVDYITISRNPSANLFNKIKHTLLKVRNITSLLDRLSNTQKVVSIKSMLAKEFGVEQDAIKAEIHDVEHHRSHMASAFFVSPFEEAALLSIDGFGDFTSTMIGAGKGNQIEVFDSVIYPHSIGVYYTAITQYLGFMSYGDEYKVMGLAPYGNPQYVYKFEDILELTKDGLFKLNEKYFKHSREGVTMSWEDGYPNIEPIFSDYMVERLGPARKKGEELTQYHRDLAASAQRMTEIAIFHILDHLHKRTGLENLCVAGGVAQNSVANGKMYLQTPFKNIYIPPAATDAGTSIGSALWIYNQEQKNPRPKVMLNANLGPSFSQAEIEAMLKEKGVSFTQFSDEEINDQVADSLMDGGVVGWFKGGSEFGPRALGYRSILADPRRHDAKEILNLKIKKREPFRPFAPSILSEHVGDYFEQQEPVPFMEKVFVIRPEKRESIPAVTHVDGTGRLQSVYKDVNPKYYAMIERFFEKSGVPIVLNTSFNENEPIVNTPAEALATFTRTQMDLLVLENLVVRRGDLPSQGV